MNTKLHAVTDAAGRPIRFFMTAGQVSDYTGARALVNSLPAADWLLGDRGYDADWFREALIDKEITPCIPGRKSRDKPVKYDKRRYRKRNRLLTHVNMRCQGIDRDHIRAIEGLEARSHAIRPQPQSVPLSDRSRRSSDFLVMSPEPKRALKIENARRKRLGKTLIPSHYDFDASEYFTGLGSAKDAANRGGTHASPIPHLRRAHERIPPNGKRIVNVSWPPPSA
jgi:transposase